MKALLEKKNELMAKAEALVLDAEQRNAEVEESAYVELRTQIEDINAQIEQKQTEIQEKRTAVNAEIQGETKMEKTMELRGLEAYLRGEDCEELRAMDTTTQGAIVPTHLHTEIIEKLEEVAPLFARVPKLSPIGGTLEILREKEVGMAGFCGEGADIAELNSSFEKVRLEQRRCGAFTKISQHLMNDAGIDIATVCKNNLYKALGKAMDRAMVNGTVANEQFEGLINAKGAVIEGAITTDLFVDMMNAMPVELQGGAVFVLSREIFNAVSKLKDNNGHYFLVRDFVAGKPVYKILGCEVLVSDVATEIYLVNIENAYSGMMKKGAELKLISADSANALRGTNTLVLDCYADSRIVNEDAIVRGKVAVVKTK